MYVVMEDERKWVRRHAFGDQYHATDALIPGAGKLDMLSAKWGSCVYEKMCGGAYMKGRF